MERMDFMNDDALTIMVLINVNNEQYGFSLLYALRLLIDVI